MKRFSFIWLLLLLVSCNIRSRDIIQTTEHCFIVEEYKQTICLDEPYDSLHPIVFADKYALQSKDIKFRELNVYIMMVVSVDDDLVTLSNLDYSVKMIFVQDSTMPVLQDMYYVIIKEEYLGKSLIVEHSNPSNTPVEYEEP